MKLDNLKNNAQEEKISLQKNVIAGLVLLNVFVVLLIVLLCFAVPYSINKVSAENKTDNTNETTEMNEVSGVSEIGSADLDDWWVTSPNDHARYDILKYTEANGLAQPEIVGVDKNSRLYVFEGDHTIGDIPERLTYTFTEDGLWDIGLYDDKIMIGCSIPDHASTEFIKLKSDSSKYVDFGESENDKVFGTRKDTLEFFDQIVKNITADRHNPDYLRGIKEESEVVAYYRSDFI
jgi:hypothetical protein